uniref:Uncharacterized protein MANES_02G112800 n=1 Tax=Rhizophora mucronata TaxID=61149 RepID=A0A2P2QNJ9_RHIMU
MPRGSLQLCWTSRSKQTTILSIIPLLVMEFTCVGWSSRIFWHRVVSWRSKRRTRIKQSCCTMPLMRAMVFIGAQLRSL